MDLKETVVNSLDETDKVLFTHKIRDQCVVIAQPESKQQSGEVDIHIGTKEKGGPEIKVVRSNNLAAYSVSTEILRTSFFNRLLGRTNPARKVTLETVGGDQVQFLVSVDEVDAFRQHLDEVYS